MKLPDKIYNILKWVALTALPAISLFYTIIAQIWGLPFAEQIPETIDAVALLIGLLIGISHLTIKREEAQDDDQRTDCGDN